MQEATTTNNKKAEEETTGVVNIKEPHGWFFHPHMTWIDFFINLVLPWLMPLHKMLDVPATSTSREAKASADKMRQSEEKMSCSAVKFYIQRWSKCCENNGPIAEYTCTVPIQKDILKTWGIVTETIPLPSNLNDQVSILVRFPSCLLTPEMKTTDGEMLDNGCVKVERLDFALFPAEVPLLVQFHGGGFVIGTANQSTIVQEAMELAETYVKQQESSKGRYGREIRVFKRPLPFFECCWNSRVVLFMFLQC
jgi:hypothetical protein